MKSDGKRDKGEAATTTPGGNSSSRPRTSRVGAEAAAAEAGAAPKQRHARDQSPQTSASHPVQVKPVEWDDL